MKLRTVTSKDSKMLVGLMNQLGYESKESELLKSIEVYIKNENSWSYVIEVEHNLVACASYHLIPYFHREGALMRITSLVVDSKHKRKGFGKILMNQASDLAKINYCDRIELTTGGHRSDEAHLFYEALEYKEYNGVRYLKDVY